MVTQLALDVVVGCLILCLVVQFMPYFIRLIHFAGQTLHLEYLQHKIHWLLGYPAGFKPNVNLAHFFGNVVLELIYMWNHVTSALTSVRATIVIYLSLVGLLGFSVQIAAANDFIFLS